MNNKDEFENLEENIEEGTSEEIVVDTVLKEDGKVIRFIKNILSGIVDQIVAVVIALILYLAISLIFKVTGYKIVMREEMFLIMFIVSNVLYYPLVQEFLGGKTLGRKFVLR